MPRCTPPRREGYLPYPGSAHYDGVAPSQRSARVNHVLAEFRPRCSPARTPAWRSDLGRRGVGNLSRLDGPAVLTLALEAVNPPQAPTHDAPARMLAPTPPWRNTRASMAVPCPPIAAAPLGAYMSLHPVGRKGQHGCRVGGVRRPPALAPHRTASARFPMGHPKDHNTPYSRTRPGPDAATGPAALRASPPFAHAGIPGREV